MKTSLRVSIIRKSGVKTFVVEGLCIESHRIQLFTIYPDVTVVNSFDREAQLKIISANQSFMHSAQNSVLCR